MLFAERCGKLSRDYSRVHERAEDLLTSTAFQLLQYIPPEDGLFAVLRRTRRVQLEKEQAAVQREPPVWVTRVVPRAVSYESTFWPNWGAGVGQPELLLTLIGENRLPLGRLLVEVKLDSGKSQLGDEEEDDEERAEPYDPDQLSRYWGRLSSPGEPSRSPALGVIYLTAHAAPPLTELQGSLIRRPGDWLGWLSWRDVWYVMADIAERFLPAQDLRDILALKGLKYFDGFRAPERRPPAQSVGFWRKEWFAPPIRWKGGPRQGFWSSLGRSK